MSLIRLPLIVVLMVVVVAVACVEDPQENAGEPDENCPGSCPEGLMPVTTCPAFAECEVVPDCDGTLFCAPPQQPANDQQPVEPQDPVDCEAPQRCPDGTFEVQECLGDVVCTRLTLCDADLICQEVPQMCVFESLCPDGDRHVAGCRDDHCYRHMHCSGPVDCLRCDDRLPDACPEGTIAVDCDPTDERCHRVETCTATLYCLETCIENPICLGNTTRVERCGQAETECFTIDGCEQDLSCRAPSQECTEDEPPPACPEGYDEVGVEACLADYYECTIVTACGEIAGCLAAGD